MNQSIVIVYKWLTMFMNGCISQWSGINYLRLWMVVLMDITWNNDIAVLEIE